VKTRLRGRKFRRILARKNLSFRALGRCLDTSGAYVSQLANGSRNPGPKMRARLLATLGDVRFEDLFIIDGATRGGARSK